MPKYLYSKQPSRATYLFLRYFEFLGGKKFGLSLLLEVILLLTLGPELDSEGGKTNEKESVESIIDITMAFDLVDIWRIRNSNKTVIYMAAGETSHSGVRIID